MKKFLILLMLLLFILSGCVSYTQEEVDDIRSEYESQIYDIEEQYFTALGKIDNLGSTIDRISEEFSIIYLYFIDRDEYVTESEVLSSIETIDSILDDFR